MKTIKGNGAPTSATIGNVGDHYVDQTTGNVYRCEAVNVQPTDYGFIDVAAFDVRNATYTWAAVGGGVASWNDLEDLPFGGEEAELIMEAEYENGGAGAFNLYPTKALKEVVLGERYIVKIGGTTYDGILVDPYLVCPDLAEAAGTPRGVLMMVEYPINIESSAFSILYCPPDFTMEGVSEEELEQTRNAFLGATSHPGLYNDPTVSIHTVGTLKKLDEKFLPESVEGVVIRSSTEGSMKKFKLSIDDSGTISATEVTA